MMAANEERDGQHGAGQEPAMRSSVRTCAGCQQKAFPDDLVRVVLDPSVKRGEGKRGEGKRGEGGELAVDLAGSSFGRGAHVHPVPGCVVKALRTGFAKSFKHKVTTTPEVFGAAMVSAASKRIEGLLGGARRARLVVVGGDAVCDALRGGKVELVVVARDAAAAARLTEVERAVADGKAIAWSDKASLGALLGRDEVAVCALEGRSGSHKSGSGSGGAGLAAAILATFRAAQPFVGSDAWWSEVR